LLHLLKLDRGRGAAVQDADRPHRNGELVAGLARGLPEDAAQLPVADQRPEGVAFEYRVER